MGKKILLVEDDEKKIDDIVRYFETTHPDLDLTIKKSYKSGLREIIVNSYDLVLIDMSLPTWDSMDLEPVGSFENFGGYNIMKEMERKKIKTKALLITMFDEFGQSDTSITVNQINEVLNQQFSDFYLGYVFYNSRENDWQINLNDKISNFI
jgi:CheY-like chemotaxis protein